MQKLIPRTDLIVLTTLMLAGLILRLDFLIPVNFVIDSDEAIVGLMAKHIAEGESIPTFYYGQNYMGSLEPIMAAGVFKLFGISNAALKAVPLMFSLVFIAICYFLGRGLGGSVAGLISAVFAAVPPCPLVVWSGKARGGFIEILVIGGLCLLLFMRWLKPEKQSLRLTSLIAALLGLGWWTNNQIIYFMLPIGYLSLVKLLTVPQKSLSLRLKAIAVHLLVGVTFFLIGGWPFWQYNLENNFISFEMFHGAEGSDMLEHVQGLLTVALPIILGSKRFWEYNDIFAGSTLLFFLVYISLFYFIFRGRGKKVLSLFGFPASLSGVEVLLVTVFAVLSVFCLSSFGYLVQAPRYLLPLYVPLFPLVGYAFAELRKVSPIVCLASGVLLLYMNFLSSYSFGRSIPGEPFVYKQQRVARDHTQLIEWLDARKITWVRTNYWIGYRLAFETAERIRFDLFQEPTQLRIKSYRKEAKAVGLEEIPLVLVPSQAALVEKAMRALHYEFSTSRVGEYVVIHDIITPAKQFSILDNDMLSVSASHNNSTAGLAVDNDDDTRWGSGKAQSPDMQYKIRFKEPESLVGLHYDLGDWGHDWPRILRIAVETSDGKQETVFDDHAYDAVRYFTNNNSSISIFFNKENVSAVTIYQEGNDKVYDWSIAEIDVLISSAEKEEEAH